ncbi:MAG: DUF5777 family beta-barrel protein [Flammeovirgaceae bacterium]|nr:DUF5777 family beta-barrel protein [Flammeovirgaceae bacterium]
MKRLILLLTFAGHQVYAQDDLLSELEKKSDDTEYAFATFKGTRVINGFSVETKGKGELEFIFAHRFGTLNEGSYTLWGLDDSFVRLGLEYGLTDRLGIGLGRTSIDNTIDSYLRYKLFRQSKGTSSFPFTITVAGTINYKTPSTKGEALTSEDRIAYVGQLNLARKFSSKFSAQLTPMIVHRNTVEQSYENNDDAALAFAARYKVTKSVSVSGEYNYRLSPHTDSPYFDAIGFGVDIETGGHVFQLVFTNTRGMFDRWVVAETSGDFFDGDIHFGFNITRVFQIGKRK